MRRATIRLLAVTVFVAGILFLPPLLLPNRFFYRNGRPTGYGRFMSALWARVSATGLMPAMLVNLEVEGRRSGRPFSVALVAARLEGETYLVSMLGEASDWVRNVRAAGGRAWVIRRGRRPVRLEEVPVNERPAVLRSYLRSALGARPHIPVSHDAPLSDFEAIAADYPVFRLAET